MTTLSMLRLTLYSIICILFTIEAHACSMPIGWTEENFFKNTVEIFRARVTKVEFVELKGQENDHKGFGYIYVYYNLKDVLKGQPKKNGPILTQNGYLGGCGVPILAGVDYIFFIEPYNKDKVVDKDLQDLRNQFSGYISLSGTQALSNNEELAVSKLSSVREKIKKYTNP